MPLDFVECKSTFNVRCYSALDKFVSSPHVIAMTSLASMIQGRKITKSCGKLGSLGGRCDFI